MTIPTLVTLDQAKEHLHLPPTVGTPVDPADADLQLKLDAATQLVCEYISDRQPADSVWIAEIESWDVNGSPAAVPPPIIQLAVLHQFGELFRFRGDEVEGPGRNPYSSVSPLLEGLLRRYHDPTLA